MTDEYPFSNLRSNGAVALAKSRHEIPPIRDLPNLPANSPLWTTLRKCWVADPLRRPKMEHVFMEVSGSCILENQG